MTVGRFNELLGLNACTWLGSVDAKNMLALAQLQGLQTGDDPVVGGVVCFDSAADGHCYVIEQVNSPTEILTTESGYNYTSAPIVRNFIRHKVGGVWEYQSGYTYQGIIYPPREPITDNDGLLITSVLRSDDDFIKTWI